MNDLARSAGSICLVVAYPDSLFNNGDTEAGIGQQVHALARQGWLVHVLYVGDSVETAALARVRQHLADAKIGFTCLDDLPIPKLLRVPGWPGSTHLSDQVRNALVDLDRERPFDLVVFADSEGVGFRPIQAKRAGLAFTGAGLVVALSGMERADRQDIFGQRGPIGELLNAFAEQYAFEHADFQLPAPASLLARARQLGWAVRQGGPVIEAPPTGRILNFYGRCLDKVRRARVTAPPSVASAARPLVSLGVTHYNLGAYLPEALASLAAQTYAELEVLVIDDGSTEAASRRVFDEQECAYPGFRFLRQANGGVSAARNRLLAEARGEYFCPFDGDDIARPHMVECLVSAVLRNPECSAMSTYQVGFKRPMDLERETFEVAFRPTGGPRVLTCMACNVYGGTMAIFRTAALRAVGGYDPDPDNGEEDWHVYVKLANSGHRIDVIPEALAYYRIRPTSRNRTVNLRQSRGYVVREMARTANLTPAETGQLWTALAALYDSNIHSLLRYRLADQLNAVLKRAPWVHGWIKSFLTRGLTLCRRTSVRRKPGRAA